MQKTILWIHGFPLSSAIFAPQRAIEGVRHVMPDLPGFGGTAARPEMTLDDYARFAMEQLDRGGIREATLAGVSMGGYIAFAAARLFPERIQGLILIDTRETPDTDEQRKGRFEMIEKVRAQGVQPVIDAMLPKMVTAGAPQDLKDNVRDIMAATAPEGAIAALRAIAARPDSSAMLPMLDVPSLVVVGEEDAITPPADAERMAAALPDAELVRLPGAAHLSNMERAEAFNAAVARYLQR